MSTTIAIQLLTLSAALLQRQAIHDEAASRTRIRSEYDYIVVGAGTAGSIVATRLAQACQKVLLIEAGSAATIMNDMPRAFPLFLDGATQDWGYFTEPQKHAGQMWASRRVQYLRGKVIGGSSTVNFMVYNRGNALDYDNWAYNYGCGKQWSYANMLPVFKRSERFANISAIPASAAYHGTSGEIAVSLPAHRDPISVFWERAWNREGLSSTDFNGPQQVGVGQFQSTIDPFNHWIRNGMAQAFLYPNMRKLPNLHILSNSLVTKILFKKNNIAYGVVYRRNGEEYGIRARKEIILSAGAVNSPQLLMLSGIGPAKHLAQFNIPLIADLPVGEALQDHPLLMIPFLANKQSYIDWGAMTYSRPTSLADMYAFWVDGTGPLTARTVTALYQSTSGNANKSWPDVFAGILINQVIEPMLAVYQLTTDPEAWTNYFRPLVNDQRLFYVIVSLFRVHARGSLRLNSTDPTVAPSIDPNFLGNPRDFAAMLEMTRRVYQTTEGAYFRKYAREYPGVVPGCENSLCPGISRHSQCPGYLACIIRMMTGTCWHPVSTVLMGNHPMAVVEPDTLSVKGVRNLRVIDASVMPEVPNSNTNIPTVAIAEKGAKFVLEDTKKFSLPVDADREDILSLPVPIEKFLAEEEVNRKLDIEDIEIAEVREK